MSFLSKSGGIFGALAGAAAIYFTGGAATPAVAGTATTAGVAAGTSGTAIAAGAAAGAAIGGQVQGAAIAGEQADIAKEQAAIKNAIAGLTAQRGRSETLRRARIARGQVEAQGAVTGTQTSSAVVGGVSGLEATTASNIGFSRAVSGAGQKLFESGQKIFNLEKQKGRADLVAGVGSTLFDIGVKGRAGQL